MRTLAVAQTVPVKGDIAANVARHVRLAEVAARERAQLVLFPELSLTGPSGGLASAGSSTLWSEKGETIARLQGAGPGVAIARETTEGWRGTSIMLTSSSAPGQDSTQTTTRSTNRVEP